MRRTLFVILLLTGCGERPPEPLRDGSALSDGERASVTRQVQRGDARTCVNPAVQSEIARQVQASVTTPYQGWTPEEVQRFKREAVFEFENVTLAGSDPELNRISCAATFVALWGGHGGGIGIRYSVQPDLSSDNFVVAIESVADAVRAYQFARNDFYEANVKARVDADYQAWRNRSQYSVARQQCESPGNDADYGLAHLPEPLNDDERAIRRCLEEKAQRYRQEVAQREVENRARENAPVDRIESTTPPGRVDAPRP